MGSTLHKLNCGQEVDGSAYVCPHCGVLVQKEGQQAQPQKVNGIGIASFVVSVLSVWLGLYFCIASFVGLGLGIAGVVMKNKYNSCNGLAIAGMVIGIITTVIWGLCWLFVGSVLLAIFA